MTFKISTIVLSLIYGSITGAGAQCSEYDLALIHAHSKLKKVQFDADKCMDFLKNTGKKETLGNDMAYALSAKDAAEDAMDAVDIAEDELPVAGRAAAVCKCTEGQLKTVELKKALDDLHDRYQKVYNLSRKAHYAETAEEAAAFAKTGLEELRIAIKETEVCLHNLTAAVRVCQ